jgi:hypothetical protein
MPFSGHYRTASSRSLRGEQGKTASPNNFGRRFRAPIATLLERVQTFPIQAGFPNGPMNAILFS